MGVVKKHVKAEFSTADDETSEKELETCYESSDNSEDEDSPQEAEVYMTCRISCSTRAIIRFLNCRTMYTAYTSVYAQFEHCL